jgi:hypothetical protein
MGFFDTLRRVLGGDRETEVGAPAGDAVTDVGGAEQEPGTPTPPDDPAAEAASYDRVQWVKKMKRILDELPASRPEWDELMAEAGALNLEPDWVMRTQVEEFMLLMRRAVSDRRFTDAEHRKIDMARELIGIPEPEAEAALNTVVAEAESFFGKPVEGE